LFCAKIVRETKKKMPDKAHERKVFFLILQSLKNLFLKDTPGEECVTFTQF
jgi:hypothetical protein